MRAGITVKAAMAQRAVPKAREIPRSLSPTNQEVARITKATMEVMPAMSNAPPVVA